MGLIEDMFKNNVVDKMMKKETSSHDTNEIEFCEFCGSDVFEEIPTSYEENMVCETDIICSECGTIVNIWSYGNFYNLKTENYRRIEEIRLRNSKINNLFQKK